MTDLQVLKSYFKSKHLHVSEVFLEPCLAWVQEQYGTRTEAELCQSVYEQWLSVDLRELQIRVLPQDISKQKKTTLQGNFAVQVMYFKDISKSSLSQIKTIRNLYKLTRTSVEKEYEPQAKRTLYLNLTDGVEYINAFEYETVSCVSLHMAPGVKLLLVGPLTVRNGEILLKNCNVKVLGGEVEELLVCNSVENVLARELKLPENPNAGTLDPDVLNERVVEERYEGYEVTQPRNQPEQQRNRQEQQWNRPDQQWNRPDQQWNRPEQQWNRPEQQWNRPEQNRNRNNLNPPLNDPDFTNDIDEDDYLMADLILEEEEPPRPTNSTRKPVRNDTFHEIDFDEPMDEPVSSTNQASQPFNFDDAFDVFDVFEPDPIEYPVRVSPEPFVYVRQLLEIEGTREVCVKAQIEQVVEKLAFDEVSGWRMRCNIIDGSGVAAVNFSRAVLEEILGMTMEETVVLRKEMRNKVVSAAERLKAVIFRCKDKLVTLNCFMYVKNVAGVLTLMRLREIEESDMGALQRRVEGVKNKTV